MRNTKEQTRMRAVREYQAKDPLPLEKLKELLAMWQRRRDRKEFPVDMCARMIDTYERRIRRISPDLQEK
jgi:hypothetical protein